MRPSARDPTVPKQAHIENAGLDELMSRMQLILGRVAALRSQLRDMESELTEFESGADELLQRLAQARASLGETKDPPRAGNRSRGRSPRR